MHPVPSFSSLMCTIGGGFDANPSASSKKELMLPSADDLKLALLLPQNPAIGGLLTHAGGSGGATELSPLSECVPQLNQCAANRKLAVTPSPSPSPSLPEAVYTTISVGREQRCTIVHGGDGSCRARCTARAAGAAPASANTTQNDAAVRHNHKKDGKGWCTRSGCTAMPHRHGLCGKHGGNGLCRAPSCRTNAQSGAARLCSKHNGGGGSGGTKASVGSSTNLISKGPGYTHKHHTSTSLYSLLTGWFDQDGGVKVGCPQFTLPATHQYGISL
jgi:hypothetical protein